MKNRNATDPVRENSRRFLLMGFVGFVLILTVFSRASGSNFVERSYFGAKFEPVNTVLHGGGQDSGPSLVRGKGEMPDGFLEYGNALKEGQYPVQWMTYVSVSLTVKDVRDWGRHVKAKLDEIGRDDIMPQVGLNLTGGLDTGEGLDNRIARGDFDAQIEEFCKALALIDRPTFVRIGYEFEGSWNGYSPEGFVASWIRITKAMNRHRLNVATVWCSAGGSAGPVPLEHVMKYYPGDEWVDWWGVDIFSPEEIKTEKLREFCREAGKHNMPVMLGEVTPRYVGAQKGRESWEQWYGPFFEFIREQPEVKSFCYINWDWDFWAETLGFEWIDWKDSRIQLHEYVLDRYIEEMDSPLYQHAE